MADTTICSPVVAATTELKDSEAKCKSAPSPTVVCHGLEGIVITNTQVSTVGIQSVGLTYRGYKVTDLLNTLSYEQVAVLLIKGELPTEQELITYKSVVIQGRRLTHAMKAVAENIGATVHPMDVIRAATALIGSGCGGKYSLVVDTPLTRRFGDNAYLLGVIPSIAMYHRRFHLFGERISTEAPINVGVAEHYLQMLHQQPPTALEVKALETTLICYAEHDLAASTFAARVTASANGDYFSCIGSAIGTLSGPLHGGANEAAHELLSEFTCPSEVEPRLLEKMKRKELIMGFGHRVYKNGDPRSDIMETIATEISVNPECPMRNPTMMNVAKECVRVMQDHKNIKPNVDFYCAALYEQLNIPTNQFTVIFTLGRLAGWTAHVEEQWAEQKIIRPKSQYVGYGPRQLI